MEVREGAGEGQQQDTAVVSHGGDIVERVTDGHQAVDGHGSQEIAFCVGKSQKEIHLGHTLSMGDGLLP